MTDAEIQALIDKAVGAAVGGLDKKIETAVGGAIKPIADQLKPLADNQKVLADTLALLPPGGDKGDKGKGDQPKFLTAEELQKALDARDAARTVSATKKAALDKVIAAKLKDVPQEFLAGAPDTEDEKTLNEWADARVARVNEVIKVRPNALGGGGGGNPPAAPAVDLSKATPAQLREAAIKALPPVVIPAQTQAAA